MYNLYYVYFCQIKQAPSFLPMGNGKEEARKDSLTGVTLPGYQTCSS